MAPWFDRKWEAILAHRTQIAETGWLLALPEDVRREGFSREAFIRAFSRVEAPADAPTCSPACAEGRAVRSRP